MAKPKPIQITIPKPCKQSWDEMTPEGQGRHCTHCQKTVTDFTQWSDTALYDFFIKNRNKEVCGRFKGEQLNRGIIPHQPHSKLYRLFLGLGLTLVLTQLPVQQTFATPPLVYAQQETQNEPTANNHAATDSVVYINIKGVILNEKGEPIIGAVIKIERHNVPHYVDMAECGAITGVDGSFSTQIPLLDKNLNAYLLSVDHYDYSGRLVSLRDYKPSENVYVEFKLRGLSMGGGGMTWYYPRVLNENMFVPSIPEEEIKECKR